MNMNFNYKFILKLLIIFFGYLLLYNIFNNNHEGLQSKTKDECIPCEENLTECEKLTKDIIKLISQLQNSVTANTSKINSCKNGPYKDIKDTQTKIQEKQKQIHNEIMAKKKNLNAMKKRGK